MGKGSNTTSSQSSSTSSADPQAAAAYRDILTRAQGVANTPYKAYTGNLTADVNSQQNLGIAGINSNANFASPYIQQAAQQATASSGPITAGQIQSYLNPYTQNVVDATTSQLQHDNAQQHAQLTGNQISQGALGGNATGVARGILSGQQGRTMASTTAGLYQQGYQQAVDAAQRQQQAGLAGANAIANYGISGQGAALAGAGQQINAGSLQQQTEQQRLNALYGQYAQAQAFPYQQTQWLGGIATGVGSNLGGTSSSTGTTTGPAPNQMGQWLGGAMSLGSLALSDRRAKRDIERIGKMNDGTPIFRFRYHDSDEWHVGPMAQDVEKHTPEAVSRGVDGMRYIDLKAATDDAAAHRAAGGGVGGGASPWGDVAASWIPTIGIHGGSGAPSSSGHAPSAPTQGSGFDPSKLAGGISGVAKGLGRLDWGGAFSPGGGFSGDSWGGGSFMGGDSYGGSSSSPLPGLDASDYGPGFAGGGAVGPGDDIGYDIDPAWAEAGIYPGGRSPTFEERAAPVREGIASGVMDPSGANAIDPKGGTSDFRGTPGMEASNRGVVPMPQARPAAPAGPVVASDDEDEEAVPPAATPTSGGARGVAGPSYYERPDAAPRRDERGWGLGLLSPNAQTGLLTAGLGMLASRSPFLGNVIGEGGLAGVSAYGQAEENDRKVAAEASKLSREARRQLVTDTMNERKQTETERHNKATENKDFKPTWGQVDEDPITGRKIMGWIDPNKRTTTIPGATAKPDGTAAAPARAEGIPGHLTGAAYMEELEKKNPEFARTVKAVGDYRASITSLSQRGGLREKILEAANRYNPEYDQAHYGEKTRALSAFAAGPEGRAVRSLNVSIDHLDTLREAGEALKNGNLPALNKIVNYLREKTGSPITTNFDSIKQVVSSEIAKAVVGGQTAIHDRDDMARRAANSQSPDQINGIILQFQKLMAGQMKGLRRAYETTTRLKNFDDYLEPGTKRVLSSLRPDEGAQGGGGSSGFKPPAGAIPRVFNGKTFYYDPTTKEAYPGQ